jgi:hypothetical protein
LNAAFKLYDAGFTIAKQAFYIHDTYALKDPGLAVTVQQVAVSCYYQPVEHIGQSAYMFLNYESMIFTVS